MVRNVNVIGILIRFMYSHILFSGKEKNVYKYQGSLDIKKYI